MTVDELLEEWMAHRVAIGRSPTTITAYRMYVDLGRRGNGNGGPLSESTVLASVGGRPREGGAS